MAPIYFSSRGNVSPETVSVTLDQDKTGQSMNPCNVAIQSSEDLSLFSHTKNLSYITVVNCYALTENQGITVMQPSQHDFRRPSRDEEAPHYQIDFRGLSAYRNMTDEIRIAIRVMINRSHNAVFDHHSQIWGPLSAVDVACADKEFSFYRMVWRM